MLPFPDPVRLVTLIVIHCTFTTPSMDWGVKEIDRVHRQEGWLGIGYHAVVRRNGTIEMGRDINSVGAHALGFNHESVGVALVGGRSANGKVRNNFTKPQIEALVHLLKQLHQMYPKARVVGHNELEGHEERGCPCMDMDQLRNRLAEEGVE